MNEIYTDLCVMKEDLKTTFNIGTYFDNSPGQNRWERILLTKGVSGSGKTVMTQKFTLDWAEGKANDNVQFVFPFTFRELNLLKEKRYSWIELLHQSFPDTKEAGICNFDQLPIVFIFDGLNEYLFSLDFTNNEILTSVNDEASVDVLLTNLITGRLFRSASVWITTTPEAACQIPPEYVDTVTEARGFTDSQMEEYFRKTFRDKKLAGRIISDIKASRRLKTRCQIPVMCWMIVTMLEGVMETDDTQLPHTLTETYIRFTLDPKVASLKRYGAPEKSVLLSLGKLAFQQLQKGHLIIRQEDLRECGIGVRDASVYSELLPHIFQEDCGLGHDRRFYFLHMSFQEFLAAVYVFVTFVNTGVNLLPEDPLTPKQSELLTEHSAERRLYQSAVDKALPSPNGHPGLFLHFLVGLLMKRNQAHLQYLLQSTLESNQDTVRYIRSKIRENPTPEQCINLFHCLNELTDHSLEEEIQRYVTSCSLSSTKLTPAQWDSLVFILLSSEKELDVFDTQKFSAPVEGLERLLPLVQASTTAL